MFAAAVEVALLFIVSFIYVLQGLSHYVTDKCGDACPCISREDKGSSLRSCPVNRMEIQGFRATMKEMTLIKHFLDCFPSLKRLHAVVEDNVPTQLRNPELSECITEMFDLYNKLYPSCSVELMVSPFLQNKWREQGHIWKEQKHLLAPLVLSYLTWQCFSWLVISF